MATVWHSASSEAASAQSAPSFALRIRQRLASTAGWMAERRARAQALRELQGMDERDLRDLRISPYDFNEIARGTFRR